METGKSEAHTNRLAQTRSPYLLQHAHNPVDWYPWGEEAFDKARRDDKPIFLSIGYSTCHWCHVMERESFESAKIAAVLNEHFVSIKLDREERPDVDKVYMTAVQAMGVAGGWPLSVWLTPELTPFYGGTYFPPEGRFGRPGFIELLGRIADLWGRDRERILVSAREMEVQLREIADLGQPSAEIPGVRAVREGAVAFKAEFDSGHGGFGSAPKFPRPVVLRLLLRHDRRNGDPEAREMVFRTLEAMAMGGIHDQLGGGFARYAVDAEWLVPHFEKMLYDNAQLVDAYVDAIQVLDSSAGGGGAPSAGRRQLFARVVEDTLAYIGRDMTAPEGAFYAAEDADSEGREGAFYVWTEGQIRAALGKQDADFAVALLGVTSEGNFMDHSAPAGVQPAGENVLRFALSPAEAAREAGLDGSDLDAVWARVRSRMLEIRSKRPRPHRDDKILTSWNGLAIGAMARAGAVLGRPEWVAAARKAAVFLRERQFDPASGRLGHAWRGGAAPSPALLDDYAFLARGLVDLYEATFEAEWLRWAERLCEEVIRRFGDTGSGGFFMSEEGEGSVLVRMKEDHDGAEPSGNSAAVQLLLDLGRALDRPDFEQWAGKCLKLFARHMEQAPHVVPNFLSALDQWHGPSAHLVLVGEPGSEGFQELARAGRSAYWPDLVLARGGEGSPLPVARGLRPGGAASAAFLCRDGRCEGTITDVEALRRSLRP